MKYTISRVAAYCGLRISYYSTAALLGLIFLLEVFTSYRSASPLYILLSLAVLPSACKAIFFSNQKKQTDERTSVFPFFCQKYHYSVVQYKSMNLAYLLLFILLAAWHMSYITKDGVPLLLTMLPSLTALFSLIIRILGVIIFRLYFHLFPLKAMR